MSAILIPLAIIWAVLFTAICTAIGFRVGMIHGRECLIADGWTPPKEDRP